MANASDSRELTPLDETFMRRALELARRGEGLVEPNPMVGCILAAGGKLISEGWHEQFGGPHAEIAALRSATEETRGATAYVTLEPCCHQGKTPPCADALIEAGIGRVVVGRRDPNPQVAGGGIAKLREAGISVLELPQGELAGEAELLIAPFAKLVTTGTPWVIAKWAMTLDGKLATRTGSSQWISGEASRAVVHQLRGRADAVVVGRQTALADNPRLTARPAGRRTPVRVVLDSRASLPLDGQLVQTVDEAPVLVGCSETAPAERQDRLRDAGVEVVTLAGAAHADRLQALLVAMGERQWTNVLFEGGGRVLGTLFDLQAVDEVHAFVAPIIAGGSQSPSPVAGIGVNQMSEALQLSNPQIQILERDVYISGRTQRMPAQS